MSSQTSVMNPPQSSGGNPRKWLIVVPARLNSERLPKKPLANLAGKPLIVRVYENLAPLKLQGAEIIVAVDHQETAHICATYNIPWAMTKESHISGTDRCAEVALTHDHTCDHKPFILNVQGDEPFVNLDDIRQLMLAMETSHHPMGTLGFTCHDWESFGDPNVVKIVVSPENTAIYFSRASVPYDREASRTRTNKVTFLQHLGVYAFRRESLQDFCTLPKSPLEQIEKLEQLRALSAGWKIAISTAKFSSLGIDTPEDLAAAQRKFHE